jgi:hypothetical protein
MSLPTKRILLNLAQMLAVTSRQPTKVLEWGRGTGKSTVLAWFILSMVRGMPRGKFYLTGTTFKAMLGDTLPSTKASLERMGIFEDVHYYVGRQGPKHWPKPYESPANWHNHIHFWTGAAFSLVSQDRGRVESRGHNYDGGLGDEAAQLDPERLFNECQAGKRTWRREFIGHPLYLSEVYASSTPVTRDGQWFLKYEKDALETPENFAFLRANARLCNAHNLSPTWFEEMRVKAASVMMYNAEVENIRPNMTVNGFYPMLKPQLHYYTASDRDYWLGQLVDRKPFMDTAEGDMDYDPNKPLIVSFDPGAAINVAVVFQMHEGKSGRELRTLRCFWVKHPSIIQDMLRDRVLPYYAKHKHKVVKLFYDRTAKSRVANSRRTVVDDVVDLFRKAGFRVEDMMGTRRVVTQDEKFHVVGRVMREDDPQLYRVRINRDNCRDLIVSMENAEARENAKGLINKDKRSEKRLASLPRQHATDLSDAFDIPVWFYARVAMRGEAAFKDVVVM